ncbi:MAG: helix-turn-helix transcriptional regulator [Lachnospiraceae bacterium]|nr:helix-turn-helix transcriptional regulator [Lachnospiraceae bacterium]
MNQTSYILQNQFCELSVSLERANLLKCDKDWKGYNTVPPFSSIGLILEGTGTIIVNGMEINPVQGQLYLLPAKTTQTFFNDGSHPYVKYYCHFNVSSHQTELFDLFHLPLCVDAKAPETAAALFEKMIQISKGSDLTAFIRTKQCLLDLLSYYLECCPDNSISPSENAFDSSIGKAISYAEKNLHSSVSVHKMAEIAGYHPSHFAKVFQKRLGITPAQFLIQKKAEYAIEQLTTTRRPISDIAESLGFSSQFYFSNFFKKQTGMTPSEYRHVYFRN